MELCHVGVAFNCWILNILAIRFTLLVTNFMIWQTNLERMVFGFCQMWTLLCDMMCMYLIRYLIFINVACNVLSYRMVSINHCFSNIMISIWCWLYTFVFAYSLQFCLVSLERRNSLQFLLAPTFSNASCLLGCSSWDGVCWPITTIVFA